MAIWQFDMHLVPRKCLVTSCGTAVTENTREALEEADWFGDALAESAASPAIETAIAQALPEIESWSKDKRIWGADEGHRIDVLYVEERVHRIFVRISAQDDPRAFLPRLIDLCQQFDLVMVTEDFDVLPADLERLKQACLASSAFRFVKAAGRTWGFPPKW